MLGDADVSAGEKVAATKGRPRLATRSPDETRERLVAAASEEFAARGYVEASIRSIADRAGVTSGTIYCHFENKADLLVAAIKEDLTSRPFTDLSFRGADHVGPTAESLARVISKYAQRELARVRRLSLELHAAAVKEEVVAEVLAEFNRQSHEGLCRIIELAKEQGAVSATLSAAHTAHLFNTLVLGLSHMETLEPSLIGDRAWMNYLEDSVIKILCCEHGR